MSSQETFHSYLADAMAEFVAFKRLQGYDYAGQATKLRLFDRFLLGQDGADGLLRAAHFSAYLATTAALCPCGREARLSVVRGFSRYLHAYRPGSAVVPAGMLPRHCRNTRFYRIGPEQVRDLMDAAARLRPQHAVRPACIRFLIGLLYSTGLRIAEALKLNLGDVDRQRATLFVQRGKFGKDRLVALSPSTADALDAWIDLRSHYAATGPCAALLLGRTNGRLTYRQATYAFKCLCQRCGLREKPPPRLHDLRHNFACRCVSRWREEGKDVEALLPVLANAMGHVNIFATQLYIHIDAAALQEAAAKFRNHFIQNREHSR